MNTRWAVVALAFVTPCLIHSQQTPLGIVPGAVGWYLPTADHAGELFVFEMGPRTGTPTVVLHGGPGGDLTYMLPVAAGLERDHHFVFYDQRGSLRSRVRIDSVTMAKHVADIETLRQALGAERINILSHSAGTLLAFEYLRAHPDRLQNLVLAGALPHKNGDAYFDAEYASLWKTLDRDAAAFKGRPEIAAAIRDAQLDSAGPRDRALIALIRQVGAEMVHVERWREELPIRVNPDAARATRATTNFDYDFGPDLARHPFPVTVINGEFDYTVGPAGSPLWKRLAETSAKNIKVIVIPNASHNVWRDAPDAFRAALADALASRRR